MLESEKMYAAVKAIEAVMGDGYVYRHPEVFAALIQALAVNRLAEAVEALSRK